MMEVMFADCLLVEMAYYEFERNLEGFVQKVHYVMMMLYSLQYFFCNFRHHFVFSLRFILL